MKRPHRSADRLVVALDFLTPNDALAMARHLRGVVRTVKVGSVLFTAAGPRVLQRLRALGFGVMLDLKFLDIPSTVELSCRAAVCQRVSMLTVHAHGAPQMLRAAVKGVREEARRLGVSRPLVLGVTVLTSVQAMGRKGVQSQVLSLAARVRQAGCDGVVASAHEARALRRRFGTALTILCPGIRPSGAATGDPSTRSACSESSRAKSRDDQQRVMTPAKALTAGADFLVVGRPITTARNPRTAAQTLLREMEAVDAC